jgi:RNA polymerase sigma factor (sigma-70 family)
VPSTGGSGRPGLVDERPRDYPGRVSEASASDFELVARWTGGDSTAGDLLARRHYDRVARFFELKAPRAADDLTQRTFLALVSGHGSFRGDGSFLGYLFGIARRTLLHHIRDAQRFERVIVFAEHDAGESAPTPSRVVATREEQRLLLRALDELDADSQMALQLFYWEGMRNREIAEVLEIPVSTVTSRLHRARNALGAHIAVMPAKEATRQSLLADVEGWTRSLGVPTAQG